MKGNFSLPAKSSLRQSAADAAGYLADCGVADARTDAWYLLEFVTGLTRAEYLAEPARLMRKEQRDVYTALVNQRGRRIPLQYLIGEQEFMGIPFLVSDRVLIPRQDTETLAEAALERLSREKAGESRDAFRVLEIGTGSGCIAISLEILWEEKRLGAKTALPPLLITASDLSEEALLVAKENADRLLKGPLRERVRFVQSDLYEAIPPPSREDPASEGFAMILSNPPYIRTEVLGTLAEEVRLHEPLMALDGGADGLTFYRGILGGSSTYLRPGGSVLVEIGYDQGPAVEKMFRAHGFLDVNLQKDLSGNDRVVSGHLKESGCLKN